MSDITPAPRRRPLWRLFIMPVLLLIAAAAWSAFWFYSASQVDVTADAWRAREARAGRVYDCARRSVAGYPFRLEVRCDGASVALVSQTAGQTATQAPITAKLGADPGGGAGLRSEIADRGIHRAGDDFRLRQFFVDDRELAHGPQQHRRTARRSAAGLAGVRRSRDRSRQLVDADAAGARQTYRTARPHRRRFAVGSSGDRNRVADRRRQHAGSASAAGAAVRRRRAGQIERPEGFRAKALAAAVSRTPGRRRPCRDRAVADSAGRSGRGRQRARSASPRKAVSTANCR